MYVCVYLYVYMCVYVYVCVGVYVQIHMYIFEEWFFFSLFSFLFCVPYSCLPTVSLEVDVQTLKPPSARPRTGKHVRVGYNKKKKKKKPAYKCMLLLHAIYHLHDYSLHPCIN